MLLGKKRLKKRDENGTNFGTLARFSTLATLSGTWAASARMRAIPEACWCNECQQLEVLYGCQVQEHS